MKGESETIKSVKPILALILILAVVGISGCTAFAKQNNTYSDNGISFNYPSSWEKENSSSLESGEIVGVLDPNATSSGKANTYEEASTVLRIGTKSLSQGDTIASYYNNLVKQGQNYQDYKLVSNREFTLNGQPAYEIVYTCKQEGGADAKCREVLLERNGKVYDIVSMALVNDFDNNAANFDMIINSFKVQ